MLIIRGGVYPSYPGPFLMAEGALSVCGICDDIVKEPIEYIVCTNCKGVYHLDCYSQEFKVTVNFGYWQCINCTHVLAMNEEEENLNACNSPHGVSKPSLLGSMDNNLELRVFPEEYDNRRLINKNEIDPDQNYFLNVNWDSPYTTLHSWHDKIESVESNFSILHINCRSLFYKLDEICNTLNYLPVTILTLTFAKC